jgi:hypothetical protein
MMDMVARSSLLDFVATKKGMRSSYRFLVPILVVNVAVFLFANYQEISRLTFQSRKHGLLDGHSAENCILGAPVLCLASDNITSSIIVCSILVLYLLFQPCHTRMSAVVEVVSAGRWHAA